MKLLLSGHGVMGQYVRKFKTATLCCDIFINENLASDQTREELIKEKIP